MKFISLFGFGSAVLGLVCSTLPGCSKRESTTTGAAKILRISQRNEPADLDPALAALPDDFFIIRALSEGLITPAPQTSSNLLGYSTETPVDARTQTTHQALATFSGSGSREHERVDDGPLAHARGY